MTHPHVFLSYSHDSPEHSEWVRKLATDLRRNGVDAFLDVWDLLPGSNFKYRIESALASADHVIAVCTPRYREVAERRRNIGIGYEDGLVSDTVLGSSGSEKEIIPVLRAGHTQDALPAWLQGRFYLDLREDEQYQERVEQLLRMIYLRSGSGERVEYVPDLRPPKIAGTKLELTIDADSSPITEAKLDHLRDLLRSYLGEGVTVTEKKRGE
jgi:hypothetical protein